MPRWFAGTKCLPSTRAFSSAGKSSKSAIFGGVGVALAAALLGPANGTRPSLREADMPPTGGVAVAIGRLGEASPGVEDVLNATARFVGVAIFRGGMLGNGGVPIYCARSARRSELGVDTNDAGSSVSPGFVLFGVRILTGCEGEVMVVVNEKPTKASTGLKEG